MPLSRLDEQPICGSSVAGSAAGSEARGRRRSRYENDSAAKSRTCCFGWERRGA